MIDTKRQVRYRNNLLKEWERSKIQVKLMSTSPGSELAELLQRNKLLNQRTSELLEKLNVNRK